MKRTYIDFSDNIIADWNELDPLSTSFIKNKPFGYKLDDNGEYTVPAAAWRYNSSKGVWQAETSIGASPLFRTVGKEYRYIFNGVEGVSTCVTDYDYSTVYQGIGDANYLVSYGQELKDFAFVSVFYPELAMWINMAIAAGEEEAGPPQLTVFVEREVVVTIEKRFLPKDVTEGSDWQEINSSSPAFIKNKTHYFIPGHEGSRSIDFSGNPDELLEIISLDALMPGALLGKISNDIITSPQAFLNKTLIAEVQGEETSLVFTPEEIDGMIYPMPEENLPEGVTSALSVSEFVLAINGKGDFPLFGDTPVTLDSGVWIMHIPGLMQIKHIEYDYSAPDQIKQLDPMFLPDGFTLPEVTTEDENKILVVKNGLWETTYPKQIILQSSTENSNKLFALSVDDEGILTVKSINE